MGLHSLGGIRNSILQNKIEFDVFYISYIMLYNTTSLLFVHETRLTRSATYNSVQLDMKVPFFYVKQKLKNELLDFWQVE